MKSIHKAQITVFGGFIVLVIAFTLLFKHVNEEEKLPYQEALGENHINKYGDTLIIVDYSRFEKILYLDDGSHISLEYYLKIKDK